jgi:hypothetical protein
MALPAVLGCVTCGLRQIMGDPRPVPWKTGTVTVVKIEGSKQGTKQTATVTNDSESMNVSRRFRMVKQ